MWDLDHKESLVLKNWCFWTVVLEKTPESHLDYKDIQPVHLKRNQSWVFIGSTDAKAETLILWPPDSKNCFIGKDPHAGKDWWQEVKGTTEDEMVGWHHQLGRLESEQAPGVEDGQGSLACYSPWGRKQSDTIEWLNWAELIWYIPPMKKVKTPFSSSTLIPSPCLQNICTFSLVSHSLLISLWSPGVLCKQRRSVLATSQRKGIRKSH